MANEILTKFGASTALDFGPAASVFKNLADGSICWCAPVVDASPSAPQVMLHAWIKVHSTAPTAGGTIEFYLIRADDNGTEIRDGDTINTADHGTNDTAAVVTRCRNEAEFIGAIVVDVTVSIVYHKSFVIDNPGTDWNVMVYQKTGQVLANEDSVHGVNWRSMIPEVQ